MTDIERKAAAYDEALERMKIWVSEDTPDEFYDTHEVHTFVFPELAENSDEKIRKGLLSYFEKSKIGTFNGMNAKDIISWLKKQGEQKPVGSNGQFSVEESEVLDKYIDDMHNGWSEEDEKKKEFLIGLVNEWFDKAPTATSMVKEEIVTWLKSLRPLRSNGNSHFMSN